MKRYALLVLILGLVSLGCVQPTQYVCDDGTTVSDPSLCAKEEVEAPEEEVEEEIPVYEPEEVEEIEELSDLCVSIPESELETYKMTDDDMDCYWDLYLYPASRGEINHYDCDEIVFPGARFACYGFYSGFLNNNTKCLQFTGQDKDFCLWAYVLSIIENHPDSVSVQLCDGIVNETTMEDCISAISPFLTCQDDDDFCPDDCNYLLDNDCPTYSLGQKAITEGDLEITLSTTRAIRHCYTNYDSEYLRDSDYGYYFVITLDVKNSGTKSEWVSITDFVLIDDSGKQYDVDWYVTGESCEDADEFESDELYPSSVASGELWFELGDRRTIAGEKKIVYDPNMFIDGDELIFTFN